MKNKIIVTTIAFLAIILLFTNISNAAKMTVKELSETANTNLNKFLNMDIDKYINGSAGRPSENRAWYCLYEQVQGGNGNNMRTAVVDIGRTGLNSVEGNGPYGKVSLTSSDNGAANAMKVIFLATISYMENEKWGGSQSAPYRLAMQYYASSYAKSIKNSKLFNNGLNANTQKQGEKFDTGKAKGHFTTKAADSYVNATKNFKFNDKSTKDKQTIIQDGEWTLVGPYKIEKTGGKATVSYKTKPDGFGGTTKKITISSEISNITLIGKNGTGYTPDGWTTSKSAKNITKGLEVPSGKEFYLALKSKSIQTITKVTMKRKVKGAIRARLVFADSDGGQDLGVYGGRIDNSGAEYSITLPGAEVKTTTLSIEKRDEETNEKIANVGFVVYCKGEGYLRGGTKENSKISYEKDIKDATVYKTTEKVNPVKIYDLDKMTEYTIYEVANPNWQYGEFSKNKPKELKKVTLTNNNIGRTVEVKATNRKLYANLQVIKTDTNNGRPLQGVTVVVYNETKKGYVQKGKPAKYVNNINQATSYTTGKDGKTEIIENLERGNTYTIYEIANSNFGYEEATRQKPIKLGESFVLNERETKNIARTNTKEYIKISGYVWEDIQSGKQSGRNNYWKSDVNDTDDKRVANVTVTLKRADGTTFKTTDGKDFVTTTDANGAYTFGDYQKAPGQKLKINDLRGAYVEFTYNGMSYQSVAVHANAANGSKATDNNLRTAMNNKFATITSGEQAISTGGERTELKYTENPNYNMRNTALDFEGNYQYGQRGQGYPRMTTKDPNSWPGNEYPINGINSKYTISANTREASPSLLLGQTITVEDIQRDGLDEIPNINLGLYKRTMPDLRLGEDLEKVEVSLNRYTHTYEKPDYTHEYQYERDFKDGEFNVTAKFEAEFGREPYTQAISQSDVVYNAQDTESDGKLKIYLTYKVAIINETGSIYSKVNEIVNYFDSRYMIEEIRDSKNNILNQYTISDYEDGNTYKKVTISLDENVNPEKQNVITIKYRLNNDAINNLLNGQATLNSISEITSYSSYSDNNFSVHYAGVDRDSRPGTAIPGQKNTYEDDTNAAPSLILNADNTRVISGTVWEDSEIADELKKSGYDKQRIGNGQYDTTENVVNGVTVELLDLGIEGETKATELYQKDKTVAAKMTTGDQEILEEDGRYEFSGVLPGKYLIRYTYGNTSVIKPINGDGKTIQELGGVDQYKSTIYRGGNNNVMNDYWYRTETGSSATRLSDAKDEVGIRKDGEKEDDLVTARTSQEEINYETANKDRQLDRIEANTNQFEIKLGYDVNLDNISPYGTELKFVFDNIDFGIIRRPVQEVELKKEISYIEVVLANGQSVIKGDPRKENIQHLKYLPDGKVHVEIDNEIIQGATLKLTYAITVDNTKCEIDYNDQNYYIYGKEPEDKRKSAIARIGRLFDYLSDGLNFANENDKNTDWNMVEIKKELVDNGYLKEDAYNVIKNYSKVLQTEKFKDMQPGTTKTIEMTVSRLLSNNQDDFTFDNDIEVNKLIGRKMKDSTPGNYIPSDSSTKESDDDDTSISITGPTGEEKNYTPYIVLGISGLIILGAGIVFIKKKIIR